MTDPKEYMSLWNESRSQGLIELSVGGSMSSGAAHCADSVRECDKVLGSVSSMERPKSARCALPCAQIRTFDCWFRQRLDNEQSSLNSTYTSKVTVHNWLWVYFGSCFGVMLLKARALTITQTICNIANLVYNSAKDESCLGDTYQLQPVASTQIRVWINEADDRSIFKPWRNHDSNSW